MQEKAAELGCMQQELNAAQDEAASWQRRCKQLQAEADERELELARRDLQAKVDGRQQKLAGLDAQRCAVWFCGAKGEDARLLLHLHGRARAWVNR